MSRESIPALQVNYGHTCVARVLEELGANGGDLLVRRAPDRGQSEGHVLCRVSALGTLSNSPELGSQLVSG